MLTDLTGLVNVVVNSAMVAEGSFLIKHEDLRSTLSPVGFGYTLAFVPEIEEVEALLSGANLHVFEAVFWILLVVISVNGDEHYSFFLIISLKLNEPVLISLYSGAMVATEHDYDNFFVFKIL